MIGKEIHGYCIEQPLSTEKGGFGEVFLARHTTSGAEAVVKVLRAEMSADHEIVKRFFNEARAAASIQHPGIVAVHNVGYVGDRAYLLMERLKGEDLETRLGRGALAPDAAFRFLRQAARAIGAAHDRGIVHRDLKPANLFIVADADVAGGERIKVLDFGIAKLGSTSTLQTQGVFGTPAYMSPEQCSSAADVDARSDLYSLGCILYEMLAGQPPFGRGGLELVAAHLRDPAPPLRSIAPAAPESAELLLDKLLRKRREERPPSCAALVTEIEAITSGAASSAAMPAVATAPTLRSMPPPRGEPTGNTTLGRATGAVGATLPRRTPWWIAGAAVGAVAIGGVVLVATRGRGHGAAPKATADAREEVRATDAPPPPDATSVVTTPIVADAAPTAAEQILADDPYTTIGGVRLQAHQISYRELDWYLAALPEDDRKGAAPIQLAAADRGSERPVAWMTFERATRFCAFLGARLPSGDDWMRAANGDWGITAPGGVPGPFQEWTSTVDGGFATVLGGAVSMPPADRAQAASEPTLMSTEASAGPGAAPKTIAKATIGFRCAPR